MREVRQMFDTIKTDPLRPRTKVKITGEFWAMTTVGDGNFELFDFLEKEGSELIIEPVASLIQFLFSKGTLRHRNRKSIILKDNVSNKLSLHQKWTNFKIYHKKLLILKVGYSLFRREYHRLLNAVEGNYHHLIHQPKLQSIAHKYYNINIEGGEGYMEIAKNIYYQQNALSHMVVSLKPFGCMPSTQSDGAQALAMEDHKDIIFIPIETAGEGKTNAQSRVLMALGEARVKAKLEMKEIKNKITNSMDTINKYVEEHPVVRRPSLNVPHYDGIVGRSANHILHIDELIQAQNKTGRTL